MSFAYKSDTTFSVSYKQINKKSFLRHETFNGNLIHSTIDVCRYSTGSSDNYLFS